MKDPNNTSAYRLFLGMLYGMKITDQQNLNY